MTERRITLSKEGQSVIVSFAGATVADTTEAITLREADYPPVLYIPLADVTSAYLVPTDKRTTCPFKGEARYYTLTAGGQTAENAVWAYDTPHDAVVAIAGHVAFYPDKVAISVS